MARHSKNNTANPIFTYHERKKVKDVGTLKERLGKDSMRKFEECWICLRNAEYPVSTPYGHIFCKMCILNNLLVQKKKYTEKKREYEEHLKEMKRKKKELYLLENEEKKKKFVETLERIDTKEEIKEEPDMKDISSNFWITNNLKVKKDGIQKTLKPPSKHLICPISNKSLKIKDLITIHPEIVRENDSSKETWVCSFSKKSIDTSEAILIKKTGQIILKSFFEKYIYGKKNTYDVTVEEGDFIKLQPAGTAFCSHNNVENKKYRESLL